MVEVGLERTLLEMILHRVVGGSRSLDREQKKPNYEGQFAWAASATFNGDRNGGSAAAG